MKTGWLVVISVWLTATVIRAMGPAPVADVAAVAYLLVATAAFRRPRLAGVSASSSR